MRHVTAFEHGWLEVGPTGDLCAAEADALAAASTQFPAGCLQWGHHQVKFTQFCGVVRAGGLQIEILPKLHPHQTQAQQRRTLLTMLSKVGDLEGIESLGAGLATNRTALLDLFIRHFALLLERQLQQGMLRDYRDIEDTLGQVRGRIDVVRQQRENLFKPQRIACRFSELIVDIPINRLLHSALQLVCSLATSPILQQRLRSLRTRFADVQPLSKHEIGPRARDLNRMQRRYASLIDLAHLFLDGQYLDARSGQQKAFSLLFDMNRLFERYAASLLRPIARRKGLRLIEQGPRRYLGYDETGRGRLLMRPDIALLDVDGCPTMILDTKWKRLEGGEPMAALSPADLYQMSSYASAYRCEHVCLLYPAQGALPAGQSHLLQLEGAETAKLTLQSVGFEPDGSLLLPLVKLIDNARGLGNVNIQTSPAKTNAYSNVQPDNQTSWAEEGRIVSGSGWWLELGSVDLDGQLVTIQQGGSLLVAIASRDDGRLRAAIYQPLDARSIEILLGLAVNPHPETGDVNFRETNWEYALDTASGMRHAYGNQRGEPYLSYWEHGLGAGSDGETIPAWHKQRRLSSRPAELVAKELLHLGGLSDGMLDVPRRCANSDESDGGSLATDQLPGWESKPQQVNEAQDRFLGCMLGGAVGDALGAPVEFLSRTQILEQFGPEGLRDYAPAYGRIGAITDDTQMTLFTAEGLLRAHVRGCMKGINPSYPGVTANAYLRWLHTQSETMFSGVDPAIDESGWLIQQPALHHRRAPGNTCLSALRAMTGLGDRANNDSKGCGGVMRVAPVGLYLWRKANLPQAAAKEAFELGVNLAAITHGHATGALTAGVLAVLILALADGASLPEALDTAKAILKKQDRHTETLDSIERAEQLARSDSIAPAEAIAELGQGWIAEEALAIAIYCSLVATGFERGVLIAVNHDGDSDSTGAITGNLLGAMYGLRSIPTTWLESLELRDVITEVANDLYECWTWKIDDYSTNEEQTELIWAKYPGG